MILSFLFIYFILDHDDTLNKSFMQVLFDVVPGIRFEDALELIKMQPISSSVAAERR